FDNVSADLRSIADMFFSGYLIPGLLPVEKSEKPWGDPGSRVRGTCYYFNHQKNFGFLRFLKKISPDLWDLDTRKPTSPYATAFFPGSDLPSGFDPSLLPSRTAIFE